MKQWIIISLLFGSALKLIGQQEGNPFEIVSPSTTTVLKEVSTEEQPEIGDNPFDVARPAAPTAKQSATNETAQPGLHDPKENNPFEVSPVVKEVEAEKSSSLAEPNSEKGPYTESTKPTSRPSIVSGNYQRFKFFLLLVCGVLITITYILMPSYFAKAWRAFTNENVLNQYLRERATVSGAPYQFILLLAIFLLSVFLTLWGRFYGIGPAMSNLKTLLYCLGGVAALIYGKQTVLFVLKSVYPIKKAVDNYQFTISIFTIILGLVSFPFSVWLAFGPAQTLSAAVFIFASVTVVMYTFRAIRGLFIGGRYVTGSILHFLLYLCTVEIAPVLIGIKWLQLV